MSNTNNFTFFEQCHGHNPDDRIVGKIDGKIYSWGLMKTLYYGSDNELDQTDLKVKNFLQKDDKL